MNKQGKTILAVIFTALLCMAFIRLGCAPAIRKENNEIRVRAEKLAEYRELMKRRPALESEWEEKKKNWEQGVSSQEVLNSWQKSLMDYAKAEALVLDKLEPVGAKDGEASIFLSFQGDMKKGIRFLYHLKESDALAKIKTFSVKQEESSKVFSFEMLLTKATT